MFKSNLWSDCDGGILTTELVLVASFVTATLLAGLGALRTQVHSEFQDLSTSIKSANIQQFVQDEGDLKSTTPTFHGTEFNGNFADWSE